jgi:predicted dehydrogenase
MSIGVALVGCGVIGRTHVAALDAIDELELVALVDPIEPAAIAFADAIESAGKPRPTIYSSLGSALDDPVVGMVTVGTPTGYHIAQGIEALRAGRHVVIEKPLDVDLIGAQEIEEEARRAAERGVVATVISQHRFDPSTRIVSEAIAAGRFGRVTSALATSPRWRTQAYYDSGDWRGTWAMDGGGALMNQGVHTLDLLLALMGRPVEVYARTELLAHERVEVEDTAVATIEFSSGALGMMHASTAAAPGLAARVQVMGSEGSAVIDDDELVFFHTGEGSENQAAGALATHPESDAATTQPAGHIRQYRDLLRAIDEGNEPGVRIADAAVALATIRAVYLSATLRRPILLDEVLAGKFNDVTVRTGS